MILSHEQLAQACRAYLTKRTEPSRQRFLTLAYHFAKQQAGINLYTRSSRLWARDELVEDLTQYSLELLIKEFAKPQFKTAVWAENPMGCLTRFLQSRAYSFFRSEGNYQFKYTNGEYFDTEYQEIA
ncbi:MAG: hypothetical protein WCG80_02125 [Spirochaetales bacterium]